MKPSFTDTELQAFFWRCSGKDIWVCGCEWVSVHMRLISGSNLEINYLSNMPIIQQKTSKEYMSNHSRSAEIRWLTMPLWYYHIQLCSLLLFSYLNYMEAWSDNLDTVANTWILCMNLETLKNFFKSPDNQIKILLENINFY